MPQAQSSGWMREKCTRSGSMHNSCSDSYVITVKQWSYPMGIGHGITKG